MDPGQYLKLLRTVARRVLLKNIKDWTDAAEGELHKLIAIVESLGNDLHRLPPENRSLPEIRGYLENRLREILDLAASLKNMPDRITNQDIWQVWRDGFQDALQRIPDKTAILQKDEFWQPVTRDNFLIRLWKQGNRFTTGVHRRIHAGRARINSLLKKPAPPLPGKHRRFRFHLFLKEYLEIPFAGHITNEWLRLLDVTSDQFYDFHRSVEKLKNEILFPDEESTACAPLAPEELREKIRQIEESIRTITARGSGFDQFINDAKKRFKEYWADLFAVVLAEFRYAGTAAHPASRFNEKQIDAGWGKTRLEFQQGKKAWETYFEGETGEFQKDLELSILQLQAMQICVTTLAATRNKITDQILSTFSDAHATITDSMERFSKVESEKKSKLRSAILSQNRSLLRTLRKEKLPQMMDAVFHADPEKDFEDYISSIRTAVEKLSGNHIIFRLRDSEAIVPKSAMDDVPLKELVLEDVFAQLVDRHQEMTSEIAERMEKLGRNISEIDQIVEFNLEAALNLLQEGEEIEISDQAQQVVIDGLERTHKQIDNLVEQGNAIVEITRERLQTNTMHFERQIEDLGDSEKILKLKLRLARAKTKEEMMSYRSRALQFIKRVLPVLLVKIKGFFQGFLQKYSRFRKVTGLASGAATIEDELSDFIVRTRSRIETLPYVYQRLFRLEPLEDERFFAGRDSELKALEKAFATWEENQQALTILVGEKGSGKTTLLNFAESNFHRHHQVKKIVLNETQFHEQQIFEHIKDAFDFENAGNLEGLEEAIMSGEERRIVIVENLQNLFIRTVNGFDALERFLLFISRTSIHVCWIITCTLYSWQYLNKVLNLSRYFKFIIELGAIPENEIEKIILKRHRVSGFDLEFSVPEEVAGNRKYKKLSTFEEKQAYLQNLFFEELNDVSSGNISVAMLFWLRAITGVSKEKLTVSPLINFDYSFLHLLPAEELFTLAALLQHEVLTTGHHALIFRQDIKKSYLLLNRMRNIGILNEGSTGFLIHPFLYRPVVRTLKSKYILH